MLYYLVKLSSNGPESSQIQPLGCPFLKTSASFYASHVTFPFFSIEKVSQEFSSEKDSGESPEDRRVKKNLCSLVHRINASPQSIGKNEKFHVWICLGLK